MNKSLLALVGGLAFTAVSNQAQIFSDNFESYANDTDLTAVWTRVSGTTASIGLAADPLNAANQTVQQTSAAGRLRHVVAPTGSTAANPLVYSFDFYDGAGAAGNSRLYGEIRNSVSTGGLLAAGTFNLVNIGTFSQTRYQARNLDAGAGIAGNQGWIQLNAPRSVGWHNFKFVIGGNKVDLFVDGVLDPAFTQQTLLSSSYTYDWLHLGSALSSGTTTAFAQFDNVSLTVIPEPATYAAVFGGLALGGALLRRRFQS